MKLKAARDQRDFMLITDPSKLRRNLFRFFMGSAFSLFISALITLFTFETSLAQTALSKPTRQRVITVGSELDYPPYSFVNADGEPEGFAIELIRAAAAHSGLEIRHRVAPWPQVLDALASGTIDATPLLAFSFERTKLVEFSDSHIIGFDAVFIREAIGTAFKHRAISREKLSSFLRATSFMSF